MTGWIDAEWIAEAHAAIAMPDDPRTETRLAIALILQKPLAVRVMAEAIETAIWNNRIPHVGPVTLVGFRGVTR